MRLNKREKVAGVAAPPAPPLPTSLETTPAAFIQGWRGCENTGAKRAATRNRMGRERHTQVNEQRRDSETERKREGRSRLK